MSYTEQEIEYQQQAIGLAEYHQKVDSLEQEILSHPETLFEPPTDHLFTDGLYVRTMYAPAGSLITTKTHKTEHPFVVLQGEVSVVLPDGSTKHITAPYIGVTKPGTRRVALVHKDTIWVTFHLNPNNGTDLERIEDRLIERRELANGKTAHEIARSLMFKQIEEL